MTNIFAQTLCSQVADGVVSETGRFRDLIVPTSPTSGGADDAYATTGNPNMVATLNQTPTYAIPVGYTWIGDL